MKKIKITAFLLACLMLLSLAACKQGGEGDESSSTPGTTEGSEEISSGVTEETTSEEKVDVLAMIKHAEELADAYTSGVQTSTMTMKMGDNVTSQETSVMKKNGNNASYTVTSSGEMTECINLTDGKIWYYSGTYGALILTDATLDDFEGLVSPDDGELDPFDFEDPENYTEGSAVKTADGYDFTIGFSEKGTARLISSMNMPAEYTVKANKLLLSGKIDSEGHMPSMRFEMGITMSMSGISVTLDCEAEMKFSQVGEDVKLDPNPTGAVYVEFGSAADFNKYFNASLNHASHQAGDKAFEFEREFKLHQPTGGAQKPFALDVYTKSAFDPTKGATYLIDNRTTGRTVEYYSNLIDVIFKESAEKIHVDPSIKHEQVLASIVSELYATELGTLYCGKVESISNGTYRFNIEEQSARALLSAYISNNFGVEVTDVSIARAQYIVTIGEDGNYTSISIEIDCGFSYGANTHVVALQDCVRIHSYGKAEIVPLVPVA